MDTIMEFACMLLFHVGLTCRRSTLEFNRAVAATWNLGLVAHALSQSLDSTSFFTKYAPMPTSFMIAVCNESIFYTIHLVEEIWANNAVYAAHHAGALCAIAVALNQGYRQPMIVMFGVFTASSPFLYISKWAHHKRHDTCAKVTFALFAVVFFASRIVACPLVLKQTMVDALYIPDVDMVAYVACNTILGALYILQWHWFKRIGGVLKHQVFGKAIKAP